MGQFVAVLLLIIIALIMLRSYYKSNRPLRNFLIGSVSGFIALTLVNYIGRAIGFYFSVNFFTLACSLIAGIPGVAALILIRIFF